MPAAFNPGVAHVDQEMGAHSSHTAPGSRFNDIDSRGPIVLGANVIEAVAEYKRGNFTVEDLKQLAFAMGFQLIAGKDTAALTGQVAELKSQLANAQHRAEMAEGAYREKNEISDEAFAAMAAKSGFISKADADAATANTLKSVVEIADARESLTAMTTRATTAEDAMATAQSELATMTTRATTAEAALATANTPKAAQ